MLHRDLALHIFLVFSLIKKIQEANVHLLPVNAASWLHLTESYKLLKMHRMSLTLKAK